MDFAMVLSDSLYTIWHNFMHGKDFGAGKTEILSGGHSYQRL